MIGLRIGFVSSESGSRIPIRIRRWQDRTFLECDEPDQLLSHLGLNKERSDQARGNTINGAILRGVYIPGEGGYFQLFDHFGAVNHEPLWLSDKETVQRLLSSVLWEVTEN